MAKFTGDDTPEKMLKYTVAIGNPFQGPIELHGVFKTPKAARLYAAINTTKKEQWFIAPIWINGDNHA